MEKPLIKLYIVMIVSIAVAMVVVPSVVGHTVGWAEETITYAQILTAGADNVNPPAPGTGKVVFVMDDGWKTQYSAGYKVLKRFDFPACIAVIPEAVGLAEYMDYSELATLYNNGWDMLNHTYNHFNLSEHDEREQSEQMLRGRTWLKDKGFVRGSDIVVYPGGAYNDLTLQIMNEQGLVAGRSLATLWVTSDNGMLEDTHIFNVLSTSKLENIKSEIDKAAVNESTLVLLFHKIEPVTNDTKMQVDEETLKSIAAYIDGYGDEISVVTLSSLLAAAVE